MARRLPTNWRASANVEPVCDETFDQHTGNAGESGYFAGRPWTSPAKPILNTVGNAAYGSHDLRACNIGRNAGFSSRRYAIMRLLLPLMRDAGMCL